MISLRLLWLFTAALFFIIPINLKAEELYSVDSTIDQMCPHLEETPMGMYIQHQESPRTFRVLTRDIFSRLASHAPGLLLASSQGSWLFLLSLAALWDTGISVDSYVKPDNTPPRSATQGFVVDFISSAGAVAVNPGWGTGVIFPALLIWKYLTRTATINTADIAEYKKQVAFKITQTTPLINNINQYNGRLRMCSKVSFDDDPASFPLAKFVSGHRQNDLPLMAYVYPHLDPCRNIDTKNAQGHRKCQHFRKVRNLYEKVSKLSIKSRFKFHHKFTRGVVSSLVNEELGLTMTLLRPQANLDKITFDEEMLIPEDGWRLVEFSDYDDYEEMLNASNDNFQYFVTVVGRKKL